MEAYEINSSSLDPSRRHAIGSWVLGITYMKQIGEVLTTNEFPSITIDPINGSTKNFLASVREEEFQAVRTSFETIKPDSNAHLARLKMGIVSKTMRDSYGNPYLYPNPDFIIATHYHESSAFQGKINAELAVSELIDPEQDEFISFYLDRTKANLDRGQDVKLAEVIADTQHDIEFWLSQET